MNKKILLFTLVSFFICSFRADEGMWIPSLLSSIENDMQANGLRLSAEDIYSVNKSSLKDAIFQFGGGCTSEIISSQGLLLTNHHCGYSSIQSHSSVENDYLKNGFWAKSMKEELPVKTLTAMRVVRIEDVTQKVMDKLDKVKAADKKAKIVEIISKELTAEAVKGTGYEAFVRPFYYGNEYYMIVTETFKDVRLVGAPPSSIGKFGGDTDNWMWPRHNADFSIFRIYANKDNSPAEYSEENVPYSPKNVLSISTSGIEEGDFTMVYGFPGRTEQYLPSYAIDYVQKQGNPAKIKMREASLSVIDAAMRSSDELRIKYAAKQSRISNAYKKWIGQTKGLKKLRVIENKQNEEADFQSKVNAKDNFKDQYGNLIPEMENNYKSLAPFRLARDYFIEFVYYGPEVVRFVNRFEKLITEYDKLEEEGKLQEEIENLKKSTKGHFKNYSKEVDKEIFVKLIKLYRDGTEPNFHPSQFDVLDLRFDNKIQEYGDFLYSKSIFVDEEKMNKLLANPSKSALLKIRKKDAAYHFMRSFYDMYEEKVYHPYHGLNNDIQAQLSTYMKALMEVMPDNNYFPDANSTLRLAHGKVSATVPQDAVEFNYYTTLDGILAKYVPGDSEFDLPEKLITLHKNKRLRRLCSFRWVYACLFYCL